ncbi:hypothetical protein Taro_054616 [Colocasia esculenta]|uniref:Uncharacterized protein n=1 Tax=Colocasia esculenta TaxID=4460 RepID=A0A843XP71_COLES|nr:hypothetical protein [Colocasia esculenta]
MSVSPNYERATSDNTTNSLSSRCPTAVFPSAGRTTQHKSEGVQEDDKTSSVPSTETSLEHSCAWLTQNLGLPTEEVSTEGIKLHATYIETTCTTHKPRCSVAYRTRRHNRSPFKRDVSRCRDLVATPRVVALIEREERSSYDVSSAPRSVLAVETRQAKL